MITIQADSIAKPALDERKVTRWIKSVAADYGFSVGNINYIFCSDERELEVNRQFLGHDYYTDIITFDYSTPSVLNGDIFISLDTVRSNAEELLGGQGRGGKGPYEMELHRVIIHGVLHLCGINDKGPGEREVMEACENKALDLLLMHNS